MNIDYQNYIKQIQIITIQEAEEIHQQIINAIEGNSDAKELFNELMEVAIEYSNIRGQWLLWDNQKKMEKDSLRTSTHNSVITHFNMLARFLKKEGKDDSWRDKLGYVEDNPYNRKRIGDFACYLAFIYAINAR